MLGALVFGLFRYVQAKRTPWSYHSEYSFMVKESQESGSMFSNLLGQFGLSGSQGTGDYNLDKLVQIANSKKIINRSLFTEYQFSDRKDILLNKFIEVYEELDIGKEEDEERLKIGPSPTGTTRENKIVQTWYKFVTVGTSGDGCVRIVYDDKSGIIHIGSSTYDEELSMALTNTIYENLSKFYITQAREKQIITLEKLELKADSLRKTLMNLELELAKINDQGFGVILNKDKVRTTRLQNEVFLTNTMYSEVIKNVENASFVLKNATPVFQTLDAPKFPLKKTKPSTIKRTFFGLVVGGILAIAVIIGLYILRLKWDSEQANHG